MAVERVLYIGEAIPASLRDWSVRTNRQLERVRSTADSVDFVLGGGVVLVVATMSLPRLGELAGVARLRELPGGRNIPLVLVCPAGDIERLGNYVLPLRVTALLPEPLDVTALIERTRIDAPPTPLETARRREPPPPDEVIRGSRSMSIQDTGSARRSSRPELSTITVRSEAHERGPFTVADLRSRVQLLSKQDHFERLGVPRDATAEQVADAHALLASRLRPALYAGDADALALTETLLRGLTVALRTLEDPAARAAYLGLPPPAPRRSTPPPGPVAPPPAARSAAPSGPPPPPQFVEDLFAEAEAAQRSMTTGRPPTPAGGTRIPAAAVAQKAPVASVPPAPPPPVPPPVAPPAAVAPTASVAPPARVAPPPPVAPEPPVAPPAPAPPPAPPVAAPAELFPPSAKEPSAPGLASFDDVDEIFADD